MRRAFAVFVPLVLLLVSCSRDPKVVSQRYVDTGNKYFDKGKYKEATIMYSRALQKNLRNPEAYYKLGMIDLKQGMMAEARRMFLRASELDPNNIDAMVHLGDIDMGAYFADPINNKVLLGDVKDLVRSILKKQPNNFDAYRLAGFASLGDKDLKGAIEDFRRANSIKPDTPELVTALVQALFAANQGEEAERIGKQELEKIPHHGTLYDAMYAHYLRENRSAEAEALLRQKVARNPKSGPYYIQLAYHYYLSSRLDDMHAALNQLTANKKDIPDSRLMAGDFLARVQMPDRAVEQYKAGESENPKNRRTYLKREVEAWSLMRQTDRARQVVGELIKEDPKDAEAVAMHAALLLQSGQKADVNKAIEEIQPLIPTIPFSRDQKTTLQLLHYNLGRAYMMKGDKQSQEQARLQFQETLKMAPGYTPAKIALSQLLIARGDNPGAVQIAEEILGSDPNNITAQLIRSTGHANMNEDEKARVELLTTLKLYPRSNDARYQLAKLDFKQRRFKEAESGFDALRNVNDPRGLIGLVEVKVTENQFDPAIRMLREQLAKTPDRMEYRSKLADIEVRANHLPDAISDLKTMIAKYPANTPLYVRLGEAQRRAGDNASAIQSFRKAKEMSPSDPIPTLQLALLLDGAGRNEEARRAYEDVLRLEPDNPVALNNIAYSKADEGLDLDQALTFAERARRKMPDDPNVADTIALIYLRKNLTDESAHALGELVRREPNIATFHLHYAMALYQKGDKTGARRELDAALQTRPTDKERLRIRELQSKI